MTIYSVLPDFSHTIYGVNCSLTKMERTKVNKNTKPYRFGVLYTHQISLYHQYGNQYLDIAFTTLLNLTHSIHRLDQYYQ